MYVHVHVLILWYAYIVQAEDIFLWKTERVKPNQPTQGFVLGVAQTKDIFKDLTVEKRGESTQTLSTRNRGLSKLTLLYLNSLITTCV